MRTHTMYCVKNSSRRAFTLVELLVVIAIIGVLVAMLLPAVQAAREAARRNTCQNNLKQVGLSVQTHHDVRKHYPTGRTRTDEYAVSWAFNLLPYLEGETIFKALQLTKPVASDENARAMRTPIATFACPSRRTAAADRDFDNGGQPPVVKGVGALGDYAACAGKNYLNGMAQDGTPAKTYPDPAESGSMFSYSKVRASEVTDGLSNTVAIGDKSKPQLIAPKNPEMLQYEEGDTAFLAGDQPYTPFAQTAEGLAAGPDDQSPVKFGSEHPGVVQFVFLDGHLKTLKTNVETTVLTLLGCIGDDGVIPADL